MFLIVGLGNPGTQYAKTRHNAGWFVIDELAKRHNIELTKKNADYKVGLGFVGEHKIALVKPQTFMNLSGRAVASLKHYHRVEIANILVISDDLNLAVGKLRIRSGGSDGGHNGLKSVAQMLGSQEYPRLRFGVGEPPREERVSSGTAGFVLRPFSAEEWPIIDATTVRAADAIEFWVQNDLAGAMSRFNG
jgi:PTH1 family peptidyl-tRNA hydrolase